MCIGAAIPSGLGLDADGTRSLDPLFRCEREAVETSQLFHPVEFDGIKLGIVDLFPNAHEFESVAVAVAKPVANEIVAGLRIFVASNVGQADVILVVDTGEADFAAEDFDLFANRRVSWMSERFSVRVLV